MSIYRAQDPSIKRHEILRLVSLWCRYDENNDAHNKTPSKGSIQFVSKASVCNIDNSYTQERNCVIDYTKAE